MSTKRITAGLLGAAGLGTLGTWYQLLRRPLPQTEGTLRVDGLEGELEIARDRFGLPTVTGSSLYDLCFGQGFCYGQDRLWQLEFYRRVAAGRIAEFAGEEGLLPDRLMRRLGIWHKAEQEAATLELEERLRLEAFSAGINAAANSLSALPLEMQLLRLTPEPWTPTTTLALTKIIALAFSTNMESELLRAELVAEIGPEKTARLEATYPQGNPVITTGETWLSEGMKIAEQIGQIREAIGIGANPAGSNNWAVSGERSETGMPLLAGDPHVTTSMPGIWYMLKLRAPGIELQGAALPHFPGVMIGQGAHVACSFTNAMADAQDLFIERIRPGSNGSGPEYEFCGEWRPVETRIEEIKIKGRSAERLEVHETHHGPIIHESLGASRDEALSLAWVSLQMRATTSMTLDVAKCANGMELAAGFEDYGGPCMNMVWADDSGNIGYQMIGRLPLRKGGCPDLPKPGWTGEYEWEGYVPYEQNPSVVNPESGIIVTANNRIEPDDYPHHVTSEYLDGYRAARIEQLLRERERNSLSDFQRIQSDYYSIPGRITAERLATLKAEDEREGVALEFLREWDHELRADSVGGTIYQLFTVHLARLVSEAIIGDPHHAERWRSKSLLGFTPIISSPWRFQARLLELWEEGDHELIGGHNWDELVRAALRQTIDELRTDYGSDPAQWRWGRVHNVWFPHLLAEGEAAAASVIDRLLSRRAEAGGSQETVSQIGYVPYGGDYSGRWAPTLRWLADPTDPTQSRWQHVPGQSGHPGSAHYDDAIDQWLAGQTNSINEPTIESLRLS